MKPRLALAAIILMLGCAAAKATPPLDAEKPPQTATTTPATGALPPPPATPTVSSPPVQQDGTRKPPEKFLLDLKGATAQGGMVAGRTVPGAKILLDDISLQADATGAFVIGFDRDAPATATLKVTAPDGKVISRDLTIERRTFKETRVSGLPSATVTPPPEVLARIKQETKRKAVGFASMAAGNGFTQSFVWPVAGRISSPWGSARILNDTLPRIHYGVDVAAATGTIIRAPAAGVVALAEPDLFYEGGLVMLDHGQGLITLYLHLSALDVVPGQKIKQGQSIGRVGAKGRATGPHLCWRMKWRGRNLDPSLAVLASGGSATPPGPTP